MTQISPDIKVTPSSAASQLPAIILIALYIHSDSAPFQRLRPDHPPCQPTTASDICGCKLQIGMVEAIAQLVHRDYSAIVDTFVTLEFIPPGTDLQPILPVLAKVLRDSWLAQCHMVTCLCSMVYHC